MSGHQADAYHQGQHDQTELSHEGHNHYQHAEMANEFGQPSQQQTHEQHQQDGTDAVHDPSDAAQQAGWAAYANSPAHPNQLPTNVINAYANSFAYSQQQQQDQQDDQSHQHHDGNEQSHDDQEQQHQQQQHLNHLMAASGEYDQANAMYANSADASTMNDPDMSEIQEDTADMSSASYDASGSSRKKPKTGSGRVAKACQPCSSKKRRCDGGRPECSVCKVLGTPCSYNNTGLKRGPPKGFRSGPKESAKAKLTRVLETTIRDLFTQLGPDEANREVSRVARERGLGNLLAVDTQASLEALGLTGHEFGVTQKAIQQSLAQGDDTFLGVNDRGDLLHRGSSSGIQLLRRTAGPQTVSSPSVASHGHDNRISRDSEHTPVVVPIPSPGIRRDDQLQGQAAGEDVAGAYPAVMEGLTGFSDPEVTPEESQRLFSNYWQTFHPYWPILYKAVLDEIPVDEVASRLDGLLLNAIYALAASERSTQGAENGEDAGTDRHSGELFAQAAERRLYASGLRPTVSAIQASFMLSLFSHGNGDLSRAWTFCGVAITMAMDLGLHRWPIHRIDLLDNIAERETRTRTIWSLYVLDKILCAEMGRAPMLRAREMDPPLLSTEAPDELEYLEGDPSRPMRIPSCFNACVHVFTIVERILSEVHSLRRKAVLRKGESTPDLLVELDAELEKWRQSLPDYLAYPSDRSTIAVGFPGCVSALWVWESTATILLHRPFIPQGSDDSPPTQEEVINSVSHQKAIAAADRLSNLLNLESTFGSGETDAATLWPSDYAYCLFTAAVMYLFDARVGIAGARQSFAISRDQLRRLSSRWPAASAHKQLLDGFTAVADDALGRPDHRQGSRYGAEDTAAIEAWAAQAGTTGETDPSAMGGDSNVQVKDESEQQQLHDDGQQQQQQYGQSQDNNPQRSLDSLTNEQRQQLLNFYMDSSHRFGPNGGDNRRQLDHFAPGLFDVETAFWNESAGSSNLSSAFTNVGGRSEYQPQQQQQQGAEGSNGSGQAHHGLAMLAALAPHAAPQQQQQQQHDQQQQGGDDQRQSRQQQQMQEPPHLAVYQPVQQQLQAALQQTSPFAFSLDPAQPAWNDPLMSAMNLGPNYQQNQQQQQK